MMSILSLIRITPWLALAAVIAGGVWSYRQAEARADVIEQLQADLTKSAAAHAAAIRAANEEIAKVTRIAAFEKKQAENRLKNLAAVEAAADECLDQSVPKELFDR